jgi:amidase
MKCHPNALALRAKLASGQLSARTLTAHYLERIAALDQAGPKLNAVIEINPDALTRADQCDAAISAGTPLGALHGLPVLLKDNIATNDQMQTTAGSLALFGHKPHYDATIVRKLREAGAVILGKTNLSEWANFRSSRSSSGWSSRGGQTKNPYALDRSPCGSSSGSGAAVAAQLCALAVGTETDGSVVCPSSINGIVGIKPTLGLVSRSGIIPIAHSQDTAGPMARTVEDAALLLTVLCGSDPDDPITTTASATDFLSYCRPNALQGARLGVVRNYFGYHEGVDRVIAQALGTLQDLGATLIDPLTLPTKGQWQQSELTVLQYEFKHGLNRYLSTLQDSPIRTIEDIIRFNRQHARQVMPFFEQEHMLAAQAKGSLDDADYQQALATNQRLTRQDGIDALLKANRLDALIAPTSSPAWIIDPLCGDRYLGSFSSPAAVAGYPHVTVPAGYHYGLPIGLSFVGARLADAQLIGYAYAFEQATRIRREPTFPATLELLTPDDAAQYHRQFQE